MWWPGEPNGPNLDRGGCWFHRLFPRDVVPDHAEFGAINGAVQRQLDQFMDRALEVVHRLRRGGVHRHLDSRLGDVVDGPAPPNFWNPSGDLRLAMAPELTLIRRLYPRRAENRRELTGSLKSPTTL